MAIYDKGFHYVGVNAAIAAMNGVPPEEHLGQKPSDVVGRTSGIIEPQIDRVFVTGQAVYRHEFSAKLPMRTDVGYWIQDYFPISDERDRVAHVGIFVAEITKQRRLETAMRHLHRAIASGTTVEKKELLALTQPAHAPLTIVRDKRHPGVLFGLPSTMEFPANILSERELQVLNLLARGKSNKEVASALEISEKTVETYRSRIKLKLGSNSLVELVHYAIRQGLVEP